MSAYTLHLGDCIDVMRAMPENSVDSIVTDPPYGLEFMGKEWDAPWKKAGRQADSPMRVFQDWCEAWAREALRILKPGGNMLAFGGSRTYHRLASAIEDAGFEIRDQIMWVYGSGFPKSRNLDGDWDGWGTALKPAHEPICVARKPLDGTVAANVLAWGTGALNINACRVGAFVNTTPSGVDRYNAMLHEQGYRPNAYQKGRAGQSSAEIRYEKAGVTNFAMLPGARSNQEGRWPANLIHDGSAEVIALFPAQAGAAAPVHTRGGDKFRNSYGTFGGNIDEGGSTFQGDSGSAARFFYCAKASRRDRNEGCEAMEKQPLLWSSGTQNPGSFQAEGTDKSSQNNHPTVKPTELMAYLVRLVTRPGGVAYDPFMGSGSTGKACMREGFRFIGSELNPDYLRIAEARIRHALDKREAALVQPQAEVSPQIELFAET